MYWNLEKGITRNKLGTVWKGGSGVSSFIANGFGDAVDVGDMYIKVLSPFVKQGWRSPEFVYLNLFPFLPFRPIVRVILVYVISKI